MDGHIDIDLDVEKLDNTGGRATYAEIKDYVKEKYGYSISSLNIAQMKDKVGLEKRDNYNHGTGKTARIPQCTPEKEEASKQLDAPYILHTADYYEKEGIVFLPVYWAWLL